MLKELEIHYAHDDHNSGGRSESLWGLPILTPDLERKIKDEFGEKWIRPTTIVARVTSAHSRLSRPIAPSSELSMLKDIFALANTTGEGTTPEEFKRVQDLWRHEGIYPQVEGNTNYRPFYFQSIGYLRHKREFKQQQ